VSDEKKPRCEADHLGRPAVVVFFALRLGLIAAKATLDRASKQTGKLQFKP